jgi:hypothetical protein
LDTAKAKPERDIPERSSNDNARQPFQFAHRSNPTDPSDRKIRGGLQQIHSKAVVTMSKSGRNFDFHGLFGYFRVAEFPKGAYVAETCLG